jgi:hypothetical protein
MLRTARRHVRKAWAQKKMNMIMNMNNFTSPHTGKYSSRGRVRGRVTFNMNGIVMATSVHPG